MSYAKFTVIKPNDLLHFHYHGKSRIVRVQGAEVNGTTKYVKGVEYEYTEDDTVEQFKNFLWNDMENVVIISSNVNAVEVESRADLRYYMIEDNVLVSFTVEDKKPINKPLFIDNGRLVDSYGNVFATLTQSMVEDLS